MTDMTIQQVREKRAVAEKEISEIVERLCRETGLRLFELSASVVEYQRLTDDRAIPVGVTCRVLLERP